jgi:hypothetical protein
MLQQRVAAAIAENAKSVPPTVIVERKLADLKRNRRFTIEAAADVPGPASKRTPTPQ